MCLGSRLRHRMNRKSFVLTVKIDLTGYVVQPYDNT
jgi:hypothetical protein